MKVSSLVAAGVFAMCSIPAIATPPNAGSVQTSPPILLALEQDGARSARDRADGRTDEIASVASDKPAQKTRAQVKQEVLDAIADGTLPGPGENLGYGYGESIRTVQRTHQLRTARGVMQP